MLPPLDLSIYLQEASIKYAVANLSHHTWSTDFAWSAWTTPLWPHPQSSHFTPQHWQHIHYKLEEEAQEEGRISQSVVEFNARMQTRDANLMQTKRQDRIKWQHSLWWRWQLQVYLHCFLFATSIGNMHIAHGLGNNGPDRLTTDKPQNGLTDDLCWRQLTLTLTNDQQQPIQTKFWSLELLFFKGTGYKFAHFAGAPRALSSTLWQCTAKKGQANRSFMLTGVSDRSGVKPNGAFKNKHELSNTFC